MSLVKQCVKIGQESVANQQDISGVFSNFFTKHCWMLRLKDKQNNFWKIKTLRLQESENETLKEMAEDKPKRYNVKKNLQLEDAVVVYV